jgi:hypothetical protein
MLYRVRIGVWNCADSKFSSSSTFTEGGMGSFDASDVFGSMKDAIGTYGGQTLCPTCRCLKSSLREATYGFDPEFKKKGLCYRVNCATPNDLQVGIKDYYEERWYNCPRAGGALYISGFTGSLECPKASEFCKREIPTNHFKAVQDSTAEWVIWGFVTLFSIVVVSCWRFNHKFRNHIIQLLKLSHGTGDLYKLWEMAIEDAKEHEFQQHPLRRYGRKMVLYASIVLFGLGFFLLVVGFWALKASVLAFSIALYFIVYKGVQGFREPHPGSNLMLYAYLQLALGVPSFIFSTASFAVPDILATYIGNINIPLLPGPLMDRLLFVGIFLAVLCLACSVGYVGAVFMLGFTIASHSNLIIGNLILFFVGIMGVSLAGGWAGIFGVGNAFAGFLPGALVTINSVLGIVGLVKKYRKLLMRYSWSVGICMLLNLIIGIVKISAIAPQQEHVIMKEWSEEEVDEASMFMFNTNKYCPGKFR